MGDRLSAVKGGKVVKPHRIVLYGVPKLGKSTFAANAPNPLFLDLEGGSNELDVERAPYLETFDDVLATLDELINTGHGWKTIVIDTADALEVMIHRHVCRASQVNSIEKAAGGYGKGYVEATACFRKLMSKLDQLRDKGIGSIVIAHAGIRTFTGPDTEPYDRYELRLHKAASGALVGWADCVFFARHEVLTTKDRNAPKAKAVSSGDRIIHTEYSAAYEAGNRYGLPATLPLSYTAYRDARVAAAQVSKEGVTT